METSNLEKRAVVYLMRMREELEKVLNALELMEDVRLLRLYEEEKKRWKEREWDEYG